MAREPRMDFCAAHGKEALARLFPGHPLQGEPFPMKNAHRRVLLVGEQNPHGPTPEFALYPAPDGCAGHRLCCDVLDMTLAEYLRVFDRTNLVIEIGPSGTWDAAAARRRAAALVDEGRGAPRMVLLGIRVARSFGVPVLPFRLHEHAPGCFFLTLPHPSWRCRTWDTPGARENARRLVEALREWPDERLRSEALRLDADL